MSNYLDDDSEVDLDKIVEDLDDLDSDLFGGPMKKSLNTGKAKENQKKVVFQDVDDDTSLDDLLSDGIDSGKASKPLLSDSKASKAADLFKITPNEPKATTFLDSKPRDPMMEKRVPSERPKSTDPPKSLETFDIDIPLSKPPDKGKKSSLMEDLFGTRPRASSLKDIPKSVGKKPAEPVGIISESMPNLLGKEQGAKASGFSLTSSREPRRGRAKTAVLEDPLGLLTGANIIEESPKIEKKSASIEKKPEPPEKNDDDLPEWLGGAKKPAEKPPDPKPPQQLSKEPSTYQPELKSFSNPDISQLTEVQLEQQASLLTLQQQQHELRTATVLSQQTEQLQSIIDRQKHQLSEQERIFHELVRKQVSRQSALDMEIKLQQAKIDHYIQALAKEPIASHSSGSHAESNQFNLTNEERFKDDVNLESESLIHKLEVEKRHLENILEIMKETHEKEIKILEDSHETQMHFMRSSMEKLETKLRGDTETLEKDYEKRLGKLLSEKNELEDFFKEQINQLKEEHKTQITEIHTRHSAQLSLLQKEHSETIESISRAKVLETETLDFMQHNRASLQNLLTTSQELFQKYEAVSEHLSTQQSQILEKRENHLEKQEENLQILKDRLDVQQESIEYERKQLLLAADSLKSETIELSLQFKKNSELFNETEMRLRMREQALLKERELYQEQSKWERENLQFLKDSWLAEQKRQMQQLALEKEAVAAEKAKLEVFSYLKTNSDDVSRAELEAAIRAAQEATQAAQMEKKKWREQIDSYKVDHERIRLKEKNLTERARELEELTQSAVLKREEGLKSLREAQRLEKQHRERVSQLEMQLEALAARENKIATEKLALARDRLAVRVQPEKDVSSYSVGRQQYSSQIQTHFRDVVDPQLLLLKLNLDSKLDASNQLISDMQPVN